MSSPPTTPASNLGGGGGGGGPDGGSFSPAGVPPIQHTKKLVQLAGGKVLALGCNHSAAGCSDDPKAALFDPATQSWAAADAPPGMVEADARPAVALSGANCGDRCGKALVNFPREWRLFNPNAADGTQWEKIPGYPHGSEASYSGGQFGFPEAVALGDTNCGVSCGKVFIKAGDKDFSNPNPRRWELYNPVTNTFEQYPYSNALEELDVARHANRSLRLVDGRVLMVGARAAGSLLSPDNEPRVAKLFDPAAFNPALASLVPSFADETPPVNNWFNDQFTGDPTGRLANGRILFTGGPSSIHVSEIYTPDPNRGLGRWSPAGSDCASVDKPVVGEFRSCLVLASLPNGKVLATTSTKPEGDNRIPSFSTGRTFIFDPATSGWTLSAVVAADAKPAVTHGVLLGATPSGLAGKVLTAGSNTSGGAAVAAQLYTPTA